MNPNYPVYIISKGRWESRLTSKALEKIKVPYHIVIEPQEYSKYASVISPSKILTLPFSNLGKGSIPARNWIWEHAISINARRHWILDDNIRHFYRLNRNKHYRICSGTIFKVIEDFVDRYKNIALAGMQYLMFALRKVKLPAFVLNTRIYSCILIDNNLPYRWRGRYNEDTDLSLRILKDGLCTILFNSFLCEKIATMHMQGGNTDELYKGDGRLKMAESLVNQHPDIVKVGYRWDRYQHIVNYQQFKKYYRNRLIKKQGIIIPEGTNNYGMILKEKGA